MTEKIDSLLSQMTLEEKTSMLAGADLWHTVPVERLGIPAIKVSDGPIGARGANESTGPTSAASLPAWRWPRPGTRRWSSASARRWPRK